MTTWTPAPSTAHISEAQYVRTREVTAAFEYGVRHPDTTDLDAVISHYLEFSGVAPRGLHRAAIRAAIKRGYNTRQGR